MELSTRGVLRVLTPATGKHLRTQIAKDKFVYFEGSVYLGKNDSESNYTEVSEEEYQAYLESLEPKEE